jgi:hypothetical protein
MSRVVIAGAGTLSQSLAALLVPEHEVSVVEVDWTAIHETEVALAGAETVVVLARATESSEGGTGAHPDDLNRLMADSLGRAARLVGVKHLVCGAGEHDVMVSLLEKSGVPVSVLRNGGPEPVAALRALIDAGPGSTAREDSPFSGSPVSVASLPFATFSVQRYPRPPGWTAFEAARAYFEWLPSAMPGATVKEIEGVFVISALGIRMLVLRFINGRSDAEVAYFEVVDGATVKRSSSPGRFEFRMLLDGQSMMTSLINFNPALPRHLYQMTQAKLHQRVMARFGMWLDTQRSPPSLNP